MAKNTVVTQHQSKDGSIYFSNGNTARIFSNDRTHGATINDLYNRGIIKPVIAVRDNRCIADYWYESMLTAVDHTHNILKDHHGKYRLVELV